MGPSAELSHLVRGFQGIIVGATFLPSVFLQGGMHYPPHEAKYMNVLIEFSGCQPARHGYGTGK